jgi:hypothetical protein
MDYAGPFFATKMNKQRTPEILKIATILKYENLEFLTETNTSS